MEDQSMANVDDENTLPKNQEFKKLTPGTYRLAVGAGGLLAMATTMTVAVMKPDVAGYALAGLVLFILLMLVVFVLENGINERGLSLQMKVLSWFAIIAFMLGTGAIMWSIVLPDLWPNTPPNLQSIRRYELPKSKIERAETGWHQTFEDDKPSRNFYQSSLTSEFLLLWDAYDGINVRIPTRGGMAQWSPGDLRTKDCTNEGCWGDIAQTIAYCKSLFREARC
jgi:hypothetical protein